MWLDVTYLKRKARQDGRVASTAVVIAVGVKGDTGEREVLGLDVDPSEDGVFWNTFLRSLVARGLSRGEAGNQRRPSGPQECRRSGFARRIVATLPDALHEECPVFDAKGCPADGWGHHPHRLRAARLRKRPPAVA
ncbi:MAG: transposase [Rubrobacteraceae bacterium]